MTSTFSWPNEFAFAFAPGFQMANDLCISPKASQMGTAFLFFEAPYAVSNLLIGGVLFSGTSTHFCSGPAPHTGVD